MLRGTPAADGMLVLAGGGISAMPASMGQPFDSRFEGRGTAERFFLTGGGQKFGGGSAVERSFCGGFF